MSYDRMDYGHSVVATSAGFSTPASLTATAVNGTRAILYPVQVRRLEAYVTTAVAASITAPVISIFRRPTFGSTTGQVLIGTLTVPNGTLAGKVVVKDIKPVNLFPGDEVSFTVSTAGADATSAAGAVLHGIMFEATPDVPPNESNVVVSV